VEAHNAGHVLGSTQFEIITPEGTVVYASHLNFEDTLLLRAADVAPCDLLVIEAPYASSQVERQSVVAEMVKWALECVESSRVPSFETDAVGNAQELVRIFNTWTKMPVIVHPRIARINQVYQQNGVGLQYVDASTEEAAKMIEKSECIVIVPRRFDTTRYGNFRTAYVSNSPPKVTVEGSVTFQLSDQANLKQLLEFVQEARPKALLTFYGASNVFAQMISQRFKIPARSLEAKRPSRKRESRTLDETRLARCQELLLKSFQIPGYTYDKRDLIALALKDGYRIEEVEETLTRMTGNGTIEYVSIVDGYVLS
jgi:putative mRNA 3-end processing factor